MENRRDAEDAVRRLDRKEFGRKGRQLCAEWTKQKRSVMKPRSSRLSTNSRPSKTLFIVNFDPYNTRARDLKRHFKPYGKILNIRIRRNFAFIQYESQKDATKALDATNMSKIMGCAISVEYAIKDHDEKRNRSRTDRSRDRSPHRDREQSPSTSGRQRGSPDYGHGCGRGRSRSRSPRPYRREQASPNYGSRPSPSPITRERNSEYSRGRRPSHNWREKNSNYGRGNSLNSRRERPSPEYGRGSSQRERLSGNDYHRCSSPSLRREMVSSEDYRGGSSPNLKTEPSDGPAYRGAECPMPELLRSQSPLARKQCLSQLRSSSPT